jgi:hypothetical protein
VSRVQREPLPPVAAPAAEPAAVAAAVHSPASASPAVAAEQQAWALAEQRDQAEQATAGAARAPATGALLARKALVVEQQKAESLAQAPAAAMAPPTPAAGAAVADVLPPPPPSQAAAMAPEPSAELAADAAPAVAAAPALALTAPPSQAAKSQHRSALTAITPTPEAGSRYRGDSGLVLELLPGRYRLLAADEALLLAGERLPMADGREQLQGLGGGGGGCRLWLEPLAAESGRLLLAGDCESGLKGEYRRLEPGP